MNERGFGFIEREGGAGDIFFHKSALVGVTFEELKEGDKVTFKENPDNGTGKGPSATDVARA